MTKSSTKLAIETKVDCSKRLILMILHELLLDCSYGRAQVAELNLDISSVQDMAVVSNK